MAIHPIEQIIVDGLPVEKAALRGEIKKLAREFESVVSFRTFDLPNTPNVIIAGTIWKYDATDLTTADDGVNCIIDASGMRRFKPSGANLTAHIAAANPHPQYATIVKQAFYDVRQNHDLSGNSAAVTAALQAAQAAAPAGATLVYPPATFTTNAGLTFGRNHSHLWQGTVLSFNLPDNNTDGITIEAVPGEGYDGMRAQDFDGLQYNFAGPGRHGINVQGTAASLQNKFRNIVAFSNPSNPMSFAVRTAGLGPHWNTWDSCFFGTRGVMDESADGNLYRRCGFFGTLGIYFNKVVGAFKSRVDGCFFAMGGMAILSVNGEAIEICDGNSFEHPSAFVAPVAPYDPTGNTTLNIPATIVLLPIYNNHMRFWKIESNNFGGLQNISHHLWLQSSNAQNTILHLVHDGNVMARCNPGGGAQTADIVITSALTAHTVIGPNNKYRLDRTATSAINAPLMITDSGTGTVGVWRFVPTATLVNGWGLGSGACYFRKNNIGRGEFRGRLTVGTRTAGTVIFTLPDGYRPYENTLVPVIGNVSGAINVLEFKANGDVAVGPVAINASDTELHLSGVSVTWINLVSTDPGV